MLEVPRGGGAPGELDPARPADRGEPGDRRRRDRQAGDRDGMAAHPWAATTVSADGADPELVGAGRQVVDIDAGPGREEEADDALRCEGADIDPVDPAVGRLIPGDRRAGDRGGSDADQVGPRRDHDEGDRPGVWRAPGAGGIEHHGAGPGVDRQDLGVSRVRLAGGDQHADLKAGEVGQGDRDAAAGGAGIGTMAEARQRAGDLVLEDRIARLRQDQVLLDAGELRRVVAQRDHGELATPDLGHSSDAELTRRDRGALQNEGRPRLRHRRQGAAQVHEAGAARGAGGGDRPVQRDRAVGQKH